MSNLKKVLSLGLVLVMAFGLFLSAGAVTYSDEAQIKNKEAVKLLGDLEIMAGFPDGTFRGSEVLTRAQVAKMIYVARTGGIDDQANAFKGATNRRFSDVYAGHWAEGYINYSSSNNFVVGRGDGKFYPEANITGAEFIKIMLGGLGYDAQKEGFQNTADWQMNVIRVAKEIGMLEGYAGDPSQAITRDEAALIMYNMIFCSTVAYDANWNIVHEQPQFGEKYLRLVEVRGILAENEYAGLGTTGTGENTSVIVTESYYFDSPFYFVTLKVGSDLDLIGQHVTAFVRLNAGYTEESLYGPSANRAVQRVYGQISATPGMNKVIVSTPGDFEDESGYRASDAEFFVNFAYLDDNSEVSSAPDYVKGLDRGNEVRLISNDGDNRIDFVLATNYAFSEVRSVTSAGKVNTTLMGTGLSDDNALGLEGLKAEDFVLGYQVGNAGSGYNSSYGTVVLKKIEMIEGVVGSLVRSSTDTIVRIEGASYKRTEMRGVDSEINADNTVFTNFFAGLRDKDCEFYAYNGFILKAEGTSETASNYAYVLETQIEGLSTKTLRAGMVLDDGTVGDFVINKVDGDSPDEDTDIDGQLVKFTKLENGRLNVTTLETAPFELTGDDLYKKGAARIAFNDEDDFYVNDKTVLFLKDGSNWKVFIGALPTLTRASEGNTVTADADINEDAYGEDSHLVRAMVIEEGAKVGGAAASQYYAVVSPVWEYADYAEFYAFNGTEVVKLKADSDLADAVEARGIYKFTFNNDGKVTDVEDVDNEVGYVAKYDGNVLRLAIRDDDDSVASTIIEMDSDAKIYTVNYSTSVSTTAEKLAGSGAAKKADVVRSGAEKLDFYTEKNDIDVGEYETVVVLDDDMGVAIFTFSKV